MYSNHCALKVEGNETKTKSSRYSCVPVYVCLYVCTKTGFNYICAMEIFIKLAESTKSNLNN